MHFFPVVAVLLSMSLLTACSSGSSNDPDALASTNTVPTEENGPVDDDAQGQQTSGDTNENSGMDNTDGTGEDDSTTGADTTDEGTTAQPVIDPESGLGQLQNRIQILTGRPLIDLNQKLNQGELLSDQENNCVGAYDPALGETLMAIDCDSALAVGDVAIFMRTAAFIDSPACQASLQNATADECVVDQADLQINTLFIATQTGRPQPNAGATLSYNIEQDQLILENLPEALTGVFRCQYDVTTGNASGEQQSGNCDAELIRTVELIDQHLRAGN